MNDPIRAALERAASDLQEARDAVSEWGAYASKYFQEKHDLAGELMRIDAQIDRARAALTAAPPEPEPVGEGDVGELVPALRSMAAEAAAASFSGEADTLTRAVTLLEQLSATLQQPAPGEGEVADETRYLVKELRNQADELSPSLELFGLIHRAVDLIEQQGATIAALQQSAPGEGEGLPAGYIDPEHTGEDRELLEAFYRACQAEGGTADEIHLRGLRAAIAADRQRRAQSPQGEEVQPATTPDTRNPECVAVWPECHDGGYDPRCCRFPKSCSCGGVQSPQCEEVG